MSTTPSTSRGAAPLSRHRRTVVKTETPIAPDAQMQIRIATEADLPAILAIEEQNSVAWEKANFKPLRRFTFVGTINGIVKGFVIPVKLTKSNVKTMTKSAGLTFGKPEGRKKDTLYISNIAVDADSRGNGYGTMLTEHALKHVAHAYLRWTAPKTAHVHVLQRVASARNYESVDRVAGDYTSEGEYVGSNERAFRYVYKRPDASNTGGRKRKCE